MVRGSTWPPLACRAVAGRGQHRPDDVVIAGAPAQVALQGGPDLCLRGRGVLRQQRDRRHDHARGAESALQPVLSPERTLNRMHLVRAEHGLQCGFCTPGMIMATVSLLDRAGTAGAGIAANIGRGEAGHVAQEVHEQGAIRDVGRNLAAVHGHGDLHWLPLASLIAAQTRSGVAGMSMWRTPRWLTASMTAFCAAGAAPIVPASPIPLAPSGLMPVGVSLASSSKLGSSAAVIVA